MHPPFSTAFHTATPHGVVSAVTLPDAPDPVPETVLEQLHPAEREHAATLRGYKQVQFTGGRLALRMARRQIGAPLGPVLPDARGAPQMPHGYVGSVSHKRTLAVAMVARDAAGTLGVDIEDRLPARLRIADRILRDEEREGFDALPEDRRWHALLMRFSIKESIYKAIDPYVQRYVGFHEAEVHVNRHGGAEVIMHLANGEGPFRIDARYRWFPGRLLTSVRILPG